MFQKLFKGYIFCFLGHFVGRYVFELSAHETNLMKMRSVTQFNTQNMRNSNLVYVPKMEYVHKVNIFGLKMMVKSGLEKVILKFLHAEAIFY